MDGGDLAQPGFVNTKSHVIHSDVRTPPVIETGPAKLLNSHSQQRQQVSDVKHIKAFTNELPFGQSLQLTPT
jgi:hypothetical protein